MKCFFGRFRGLALLVVLLSGCLGEPVPQVAIQDLTGSWEHTDGGCRNRLVIREDRSFSLMTMIPMSGGLLENQVRGTIQEASGRWRFLPDTPIREEALVYCGQWNNRVTVNLVGLAGLAGQSDLPVQIQADGSENLNRVIGLSEENRISGLALFESPDGRQAMVETGQLSGLGGAAYQALLGDPTGYYLSFYGKKAINLPEEKHSVNYTGVSADQVLEIFHLNFTAATELEFGYARNPTMEVCPVLLYSDLTQNSLVEKVAPGVGGIIRRVYNPLNVGQSFHQEPVMVSGIPYTGYWLIAVVVGGVNLACGITFRPRSAIGHALEGANPAPPTIPLPASVNPYAFLTSSWENQGHWQLQPLQEAFSTGQYRIAPWLIAPVGMGGTRNNEGEGYDPLQLVHPQSEGVLPVGLERGGVRTLGFVPPENGLDGFGPFFSMASDGAEQPLTYPSSLNAVFGAEETTHRYRIALDAPTSVLIQSEGGLKLSGELSLSDGSVFARNQGGGVDGLGFRIERTLPAGAYDLTVRRMEAPGGYVLRLENLPPDTITDESLRACLIEAGWRAGKTISRLNCDNRGVQSLAGIASLTALTHLSLADNRLVDLSPLSGLASLRSLNLGGNQITLLSTLATLLSLNHLSLRDNPVDDSQSGVLSGLEGKLVRLDLKGALNFSESGITALKGLMPDTTIIAPDGRTLY